MNVFFDMVGCRLNQAELEKMASLFSSRGHKVVGESKDADLIIINTCCVTAKASADSRKMIRHYANCSDGKMIVTGCWGTLFNEEAKNLDSCVTVINNSDKDELVDLVLGSDGYKLSQNKTRQSILGRRQRTRSFVKVQDGCDDHCTYCITRIARGKSRSIPIDQILEDVKNAVNGGVKEVVLTGVQLGSWGRDLTPIIRLKDLLVAILEKSSIQRIRISSIEPWDIDEELLNLWENPRVCRHFHIPLQSGSEKILRKMARKSTPEKFQQLINLIRSKIPGAAITTDIIVGFPGEMDEEFLESLIFVKNLELSGGHVFTYSAMPGTPSAAYQGQVQNVIRKERNVLMRHILNQANHAFREKMVGTNTSVLWEKNVKQNGGFFLSGWSEPYIRVEVKSKNNLYNCISSVKITGLDEKKGLKGEIISSSGDL